jgi:Uma2 family endonuclease
VDYLSLDEALIGMTVTPLTLAGFLALPEQQPALEFNPDGSVSQKMSPNPAHAELQAQIAYLLRDFAAMRMKFGHVLTELRVNVGGASRLPDVAFYRERLPADERDYALRAPDLAVEIRSPSDRLSQQRDKCRWWVSQGARVALLVMPESRTVEVFDAAGHSQAYTGATILPLEEVLPPYGPQEFTLSADEIFAILDTP